MDCPPILSQWPIKGSHSSSNLVPGTVWAIGQHYILKRRDPVAGANLPKLTFEVNVLQHLKALQLPVSLPMKTESGTHFLPWQGYYYSLAHYVVNEPLAADGPARANTMRNYGSLIARVHEGLATIPADSIPANFRRNNLFHEILLSSAPKLKQFLSGATQARFSAIHAQIEPRLAQLYSSGPEQLIHRDCHVGNFLTLNQEIVAIIDWDQLSLGPPLLDLAYFGVQLAKRQIDDQAYLASWLNDWQQLLVGYDSQMGLTRQDRESLPYFLLTIPLLFIGWLLDTKQFAYLSRELDTFFWLFEQYQEGRLDL